MPKKVIGVVLLLVGAFFAFLPHSVHVSVGASYVEHMYHVAGGIVALIVGAVLLKSSMKSM